MRFSIYTEIQQHGQTPEQLYAEVLEQIVNADRLGFDTYAAIEHFFFPKFSISSKPDRPVRGCGSEVAQHQVSHDAAHPAVPQPARAGLGDRGCRHPHRRPLRVRRRRGHGWIPTKAGVPLDEDARPRYEEAVDLLFKALANERFSHHGTYFDVEDSHIVPFPARTFRIYLGGTSDRTYELAAANGWGVAVPPLLPYIALREQLDLYRAECARHGTTPDIVWIHACHLDHDRDTAMREGREWVLGFISGNASPLTDYETPPAADLVRSGYGFYAAGIMESLGQLPFERLVEEDYVWVGTPQDILERIAATRELCEGVTEIGITVNAGGAPHWMAIKNQELFAREVMPHV